MSHSGFPSLLAARVSRNVRSRYTYSPRAGTFSDAQKLRARSTRRLTRPPQLSTDRTVRWPPASL